MLLAFNINKVTSNDQSISSNRQQRLDLFKKRSMSKRNVSIVNPLINSKTIRKEKPNIDQNKISSHKYIRYSQNKVKNSINCFRV